MDHRKHVQDRHRYDEDTHREHPSHNTPMREGQSPCRKTKSRDEIYDDPSQPCCPKERKSSVETREQRYSNTTPRQPSGSDLVQRAGTFPIYNPHGSLLPKTTRSPPPLRTQPNHLQSRRLENATPPPANVLVSESQDLQNKVAIAKAGLKRRGWMVESLEEFELLGVWQYISKGEIYDLNEVAKRPPNFPEETTRRHDQLGGGQYENQDEQRANSGSSIYEEDNDSILSSRMPEPGEEQALRDIHSESDSSSVASFERGMPATPASYILEPPPLNIHDLNRQPARERFNPLRESRVPDLSGRLNNVRADIPFMQQKMQIQPGSDHKRCNDESARSTPSRGSPIPSPIRGLFRLDSFTKSKSKGSSSDTRAASEERNQRPHLANNDYTATTTKSLVSCMSRVASPVQLRSAKPQIRSESPLSTSTESPRNSREGKRQFYDEMKTRSARSSLEGRYSPSPMSHATNRNNSPLSTTNRSGISVKAGKHEYEDAKTRSSRSSRDAKEKPGPLSGSHTAPIQR
jgi:hypothetical protein